MDSQTSNTFVHTPEQKELYPGLRVISLKPGFFGDEGRIVGPNRPYWVVSFKTSIGLVVERHRRSQLRVVEVAA